MKRRHTAFDDDINDETLIYDDERPSKLPREELRFLDQDDGDSLPCFQFNLSGSTSLSPKFLQTLSAALHGPHLVTLNLSFCNYLTDSDIALLLGDEDCNVTMIDVSYTPITDIGAMVIASKCPRLSSVCMKGCQRLTDVALSYLAQYCKQLQSIVVSECPNIGDIGIQLIAQEVKEHMTTLHMDDCPKIHEDRTLLYLAHFCPHLSSLHLKNSGLSMTLLAKLLSTHRFILNELHLQGNLSITDSFLALLCKHQKSLKTLDISFCPQITFQNGIRKLLSNLPLLSEVHAFGLRISEADCESMKLLPPSLSVFV